MALPSCPFQIYNPRTAARPELTNTIVLQTQLTKLEIKQLQVEKVSNSRIASSTLASGEVNSGTVSHARPATLILDKAKGCTCRIHPVSTVTLPWLSQDQLVLNWRVRYYLRKCAWFQFGTSNFEVSPYLANLVRRKVKMWMVKVRVGERWA